MLPFTVITEKHVTVSFCKFKVVGGVFLLKHGVVWLGHVLSSPVGPVSSRRRGEGK
jgi:hypothetical protein